MASSVVWGQNYKEAKRDEEGSSVVGGTARFRRLAFSTGGFGR